MRHNQAANFPAAGVSPGAIHALPGKPDRPALATAKTMGSALALLTSKA